jgi:hypothetical protein
VLDDAVAVDGKHGLVKRGEDGGSVQGARTKELELPGVTHVLLHIRSLAEALQRKVAL